MTEFERKPKRISAWQVPLVTVEQVDGTNGHPFTDVPGWLNDKINGGYVRATIVPASNIRAGQWMLEITNSFLPEYAAAGDWIWCDAKANIGILNDAQLQDWYDRVPE